MIFTETLSGADKLSVPVILSSARMLQMVLAIQLVQMGFIFD